MVRYPVRILVSAGISFYLQAQAVTPEQADLAFQAYNRTFWNASGKYFYKRDDKTGVLDFWMTAHAWETVMDAYARTGKPEHKQQIRDVYDGFIARHTADWTRNDYNDDIAWWIIASARAFELTGEARYLTQAKSQFDWIWRTQRDSVNGGIWWKNTTHTEKNSCVVQPMIISAVYLARHLQDNSYRVKAESLYAWQKRVLVNPNGGEVYDRITAGGTLHKGATTYNQGTYIGSAVGLGRIADARKGADWTRANMCNTAGILRETGQGDFGTFKLICVRYVVGLSRQPGAESYAQWMEANAARVWANRRADGIMGHDWNNMTPATGIESQVAAGGVALLNLLAKPAAPVGIIASRSRSQSGFRPPFAYPGDGTASLWLFGGPSDGSGHSVGLRRVDGRVAGPVASKKAIPYSPSFLK